MTIHLSVPNPAGPPDLRPKITVIGVGGAGGNAVNNMIRSSLQGVEFVVANTDAQALSQSASERRVQLGTTITQGLGAGSRPEIGRIAAEEAIEELVEEMRGSNMAFIAAGMGGGTGTGAAPVIARAAREQGILTVGVVTKPFHFEGAHRMRIADSGIEELQNFVDTLIIIPNQNLFRVANERTTFADAFKMADDVLYCGVRGVTDLMVMPGLINLDFADIRAVMSEMGKAMMGTGEAEGDRRALQAAEAAISNPLLDDMSMKGARGVLINITGGPDMTLFEVDEAANRIRQEVDADAFIIFGSTFDNSLEGRMRVSVVATGMESAAAERPLPTVLALDDAIGRATAKQAAAALSLVEPAAAAAGKVPAVARSAADLTGGPVSAPEAEAEDSVTGDAFIPPAPVARPAAAGLRTAGGERGVAFASADESSGGAVEAAGRSGVAAPAAVADAAARPAKPRVSNLFARMTGSARSHRPGDGESAPQPAAERPQTPDRQRRLGALSPEERLPTSQPAEDLLDIPAFLRRQAN